MHLACPRCGARLEYSRQPPRFCSECGQPLGPATPDPGVTAPYAAAPTLPAPGHAAPAPLPGLVGGYRLLREIGTGGMGTVYEAAEATSGRRVALKLIRPEYADDPDAVHRFRREGRLAGLVHHPRCVFVLAADLDAGQPYIVTELMPGRDLQHFVQERGPLPVDEAVGYILDVIDGLEEAHRDGVIHRDVKPSNCFLDAEGRVKVGDFGLAKSLVADQPLTRSGAFLGTLLYASPEQIRNDHVDAQTDLYSACATLFFLLTGRAPYERGDSDAAATLARTVTEDAPSLRSLRPDLPRALDEVVRRGLARDRRRRWPSLASLKRALRPFFPGGHAAAMPVRRSLAYLLDLPLIVGGSVALHLALADGGEARAVLAWLLGGLWSLAYFALPEAAWGATPGKALTGLRVRAHRSKDRPRLWRAALRATLFYLIKEGPRYLVGLTTLWYLPADRFAGAPLPLVVGLVAGGVFVSQFADLVGLLALASTMRRRTAYRGLHEVLTGTETIWLLDERPPFRLPAPPGPAAGPPAPPGVPARLDAYVPRALIRATADEVVLRGEDEELRRPVWLWLRRGAAPQTRARHEVARATRPRWLAGGEQDGWRWEAFAASPGCLLAELVPGGRWLPWAEMLRVLGPLAEELEASERDGSLPQRLAPGQVWAHPSGRALLLDVPFADGPDARSPLGLLAQAAAVGLEGRPRAPGDLRRAIAAPVPGRAAAFLARLLGDAAPFASVAEARAELARTARAPSEVSRPTRAVQTALTTLVLGPGLAFLFTLGPALLFVLWISSLWAAGAAEALADRHDTRSRAAAADLLARPDLPGKLAAAAAFHAALRDRDELDRYADEENHHRQHLEASWSWFLRRWVKPLEQERREIGLSLLATRSGSAADVRAALGRWPFAVNAPPLPALAAAFAFWPAAWALWAAATRGGLTRRLAGIALVARDGRPAPRWRCGLRALVAWGPVAGLLYLSLWLELDRLARPDDSHALLSPWAPWLGWWLAAALVAAYAYLALRYPNGGPHDRVAGTYPVPR